MKTCEVHNDCVVIYDSKKCPVCDSIDDLQAKIWDAEHDLEEQKRLNADLQASL